MDPDKFSILSGRKRSSSAHVLKLAHELSLLCCHSPWCTALPGHHYYLHACEMCCCEGQSPIPRMHVPLRFVLCFFTSTVFGTKSKFRECCTDQCYPSHSSTRELAAFEGKQGSKQRKSEAGPSPPHTQLSGKARPFHS